MSGYGFSQLSKPSTGYDKQLNTTISLEREDERTLGERLVVDFPVNGFGKFNGPDLRISTTAVIRSQVWSIDTITFAFGD